MYYTNGFTGLSLPLPDLPVLRFNPVKSSLHIDRFVHYTPTAAETRNQWFIQPGLVPEYNKTDNFQREEKPTLDSGSFMIFIVCMVGIDILMFLHRVIKAIGTGKLLLYGYPIYVDARDQKSEFLVLTHTHTFHSSFGCPLGKSISSPEPLKYVGDILCVEYLKTYIL